MLPRDLPKQDLSDWTESSSFLDDKILWYWFLKKKNKYFFTDMQYPISSPLLLGQGGRCGHDRIVVGFTTTYAISAYHH
jgi:hypothetical protein